MEFYKVAARRKYIFYISIGDIFLSVSLIAIKTNNPSLAK